MRVTLISVVALLFLACGSGNASLVANGGFETGDFTGWTVSGGAVDCGNTAVPGISTTAHSGAYAACFGNPAALTFISQTLATAPGQVYNASFWYQDNNYGQTPVNEIQFYWGGTVGLDRTNVATTSWKHVSGLFTATSTSTVIEFGFEDVPGVFGLDDLDVDPVPEPRATVLCGLGLGLLGWLRRRAMSS
jgi:hypothetical protein